MMTALRIAGWTNLAIGLLHIAARPWERRMSYWVGIGPDMDRLGRMHFLLPYALWIATAAAFEGLRSVHALCCRQLPVATVRQGGGVLDHRPDDRRPLSRRRVVSLQGGLIRRTTRAAAARR